MGPWREANQAANLQLERLVEAKKNDTAGIHARNKPKDLSWFITDVV